FAADSANVAELQQQIQQLKAENAVLKRENETLKRSLAQAKSAAISNQSTVERPAQSNANKGKYWMTISSGKRHNSACRYFMNSKGRFCGPDEGIPCKLCGG
ncbi:MAG TPA: hypothetical protein VE843_08375, partial [Ktedonobacteraceae bacterium]|nr:hypothetical protein [Ktedonobacteraceae bacterium]